MSKKANPTVIGAFALGALVLAVAAVVLLGSGRLFEKRFPFVLYFEGSVRGLDVGAPVIFKGVQVGAVKKISARIDYDTLTIAIPVYIEIVQGSAQVIGRRGSAVEGVQRLIEHGLRARLKSLSLITGKLYIDLDFYEDQPADYRFQQLDPETPEIPTIPSEFEVLRQTAGTFIDELRGLPLKDLVDKLASAADGLATLVNKPELAHAIEELDGTLAEARSAAAKLDARIDPLSDSAQAAIDEARAALRGVDATMGDAQKMLEPGSALQYQIVAAAQELERAARSIRMLADELAKQPDSIIFGRGGDGN